MKIAVASDNKIEITGHVGKCSGFLIYEIEDDKIVKTDYRINRFTNHARGMHGDNGGSGLHGKDSHKNLAEGLRDCKYLISHGMGRRLVEDLGAFNIEPIITAELNPVHAVKKLIQGTLESVDELICRGHRKD